VGIALVKEVLTCVPDDLGPSERMVLVVIAENARDATRESWALTRADLGRRAGLQPEALRKAIQRLAKSGLEVRVPLKVGKNGQPVYAFEGRQCTYRIPQFERREPVPTSEAVTQSHLSDREAGTGSRLSGAEVGTQSSLWGSEVGTGSREVGTGSRPTPQYPSSSSPTEKNKKGGSGGATRTKRATAEHPSFAAWYAVYPVHKARGDAVRAYSKALEKTDEATLLDAAKRYRDDPQVKRGYGKYPATWLNKECWLDEEPPAPRDVRPSRGHQPYRDPADPADYQKGFFD
jgi:hypothetical protein